VKQYFLNPYGYDLVKIGAKRTLFGRRVAQYRFMLDPETPLTYVDAYGLKYQPNKRYETDMGSVPWLLQLRCPKDKYLVSFLFHDSAWNHGGIWCCSPDMDEPWDFMKLSRKEANDMLKEMVEVEGRTLNNEPASEYKSDSRLIRFGVRIGRWVARLRGKKPRYPREDLGGD